MATSGSWRANGVSYDNHFFINWQLASQDVANNRSLINWQAYAHFNNSDSQLDNGYVNSNVGGQWANGGRVKNYQGAISTRDHHLQSGSFWIEHRADGNQEIQFSGGITFYGMGRSEGISGVWSLPTIPRASNPTFSKSLYTIGEPIVVHTNRKAGFTHKVDLQVPDGNNMKIFNGVTDNVTWTPTEAEIDSLYARMPNTNQTSLGVDVETWNGGTHIGNGYQNVSIKTDVAVCKPLFAEFTYRDKNAATVAITGNDQYLIQNNSTLEAIISAANKATARKSATMVKYNLAISNLTADINYAATDIVKDFGTLGVNSDTPLAIEAIDSRGNSETVTKTVKVLPYQPPVVSASAKRVNNFETQTQIKIEGDISRLTIGDADKNAVNSTTGVKWRYKKVGTTTWGAWQNVASSVSSGKVSTTPFMVNLDRNFAWDIEYQITDRLKTTTYAEVLSVGIPIFRIGLDGKVYNQEQPLMPSHVGQIIISTTLATPEAVEAIYGGKWILWGEGRVIVGVGNNGTNNYTASEIKGGSDNVSLTTQQLPRVGGNITMHAIYSATNVHSVSGVFSSAHTNGNNYRDGGGVGSGAISIGGINFNLGGGQSHENRPSFITAYQWKRVL